MEEIGNDKEKHFCHTKLYLSNLMHTVTSASPSSPDFDLIAPNTNLLCINASVWTFNTKNGSAYSLFHCEALHRNVYIANAGSSGLQLPLWGTLRFFVAEQVTTEEDRWQVWLHDSMRDLSDNHIDIFGWYTVFHLGGIYDLIDGKDWMADNLHLIDHKSNTLHMLEPNWSELKQGTHLPSTIITTSLVGLQPH